MKKPASLVVLAGTALLLTMGVVYSQVAQASVLPVNRGSVQAEARQTTQAYLGLALAPLTDKLAQRLNITQQPGLVVLRVLQGGPSDNKVQQKDVITKINGTAVSDLPSVHNALANVKAGDTVTLDLVRGTNSLTTSIVAAVPPARPDKGGNNGPRGHGQGMHPRLLELQGIPQSEIFDHLVSRQTTILDKDGNPVTYVTTFGKVVSATDSSLTIDPNGPSTSATYTITANTHSRIKTADLKAGDNVAVTARNGSTDAYSVIRVPTFQAGNKRTQDFGPGMPNAQGFHFGMPNTMGQNGAMPQFHGANPQFQRTMPGVAPSTVS